MCSLFCVLNFKELEGSREDALWQCCFKNSTVCPKFKSLLQFEPVGIWSNPAASIKVCLDVMSSFGVEIITVIPITHNDGFRPIRRNPCVPMRVSPNPRTNIILFTLFHKEESHVSEFALTDNHIVIGALVLISPRHNRGGRNEDDQRFL